MTPKGSEGPSQAAQSHDQANPDWPWRSLHGWKWSDDIAQSKPASSARLVQRSRSEGANCSCETWYPKRAIFFRSLQMRFRRHLSAKTVCCRYSRPDAGAGRVPATPQRKRLFLSSREARTVGRELLDANSWTRIPGREFLDAKLSDTKLSDSDITRLVEMNEFGFASGT